MITSDGRHTTLGRMTDPTHEELVTVESRLEEIGLTGWLVVSEGHYYGPGELRLMVVRALLVPEAGDWHRARDRFFAIRSEIQESSPS